MQQIAIQDANILIDLVKTGLFAHCLALEFQFMTTDLVFEELYESQQEEIQPHIDSGKFKIINISKDELTDILEVSLEDKGLSEQDWSTVYYAEKWTAILVSRDERSLAVSKKIEVRGILWILDLLEDKKILTNAVCCDFLSNLMTLNKRLPLHEVNDRLRKWHKD